MRFQEQVAVITAAGAGIGKATAEIMVAEGATVVAIDVDSSRLSALQDAMAGAPGALIPKVLDAADQSLVQGAVAEIWENQGRIDILVNAVGGSTIIEAPAATVDELSFEDWQKVIDFNLNATFLFCNTVVPLMKQAGHGKIVNLASIAGRGLSGASSSAYAAAKGGIIAFTRKLSHELGPSGINVNAIAPSLTLTERIRPHWEKRNAQSQAREIERTPLRRVAEAVDQARVIAFLASQDADFITGLTIDVTGGIS
ncbi:MAG: SDR family oxidoreductase [Rhodospirillaceae bacterium]|jgi:NAD(P)-dependent dehydrogenase (short-subunit alcohol dehydrogenase family)|nr:SDR family oxidoreductase [Rhodospirillaceae bacterium]MBT5195803.1 SDR family oxidoreductase [Rhodospirillaceae bacterium]MBT7757871.1 SDR family oxidoreductase [Rhodospirillaceae bacterium]